MNEEVELWVEEVRGSKFVEIRPVINELENILSVIKNNWRPSPHIKKFIKTLEKAKVYREVKAK